MSLRMRQKPRGRRREHHSFRRANSSGLGETGRKRSARIRRCKPMRNGSPGAVGPSEGDDWPDHLAVAVHSRALLSHSPRGLDDEFDLAFLEQINRLTAIQPIIRLSQEVQDGPGIVGGQRLTNRLEPVRDSAVRVELKRWKASVIAGPGNSKEATFLHALIDGLTRDASQKRSDLVEIVGAP